MTVLDYIFFGALGVAIFFGLWKGFVRQIFALVGVFVVALGTSYLSPYPAAWLENAIEFDTTRNVVAMLLTLVVLAVVYIILTKIISKIINKSRGIGKINRLLGAVFAVAVVYLVFGFVTALVVETSEDFLTSMKTSFNDSWVVNTIYGGAEQPERNFFGHWLLDNLFDKIESLRSNIAS